MRRRRGPHGTCLLLLAALFYVAPTLCALLPAPLARRLVRWAEAAPIAEPNLRVGLAWDRWAVDCAGVPGGGVLASADRPLWPGAAAAVSQAPAGAGRYALSLARPVLAVVATDSAWLSRAAAVAAARLAPPESDEAAGGFISSVPSRGLWYCLYTPPAAEAGGEAGAVGIETARRKLLGLGWPAVPTLWPAPQGADGAGSGCLVRLDGPLSGLVYRIVLPFALEPSPTMPYVRHGDSAYRGTLEALRAGASGLLSLVNRVGVEEYLLGVVPSEMPPSWPLEALKAQAVAARTYAMRNLGRHGSRGFDLCFDIHCQAYGGQGNEHGGTSAAVRATRGVVATYQGRLINAVYHAHAGGATDSSQSIWGTRESYLVGTARTYEGPYYWTASNTREDVEAAAQSNLGSLPEGLRPLLDLTPRDFTAGHRALRVELRGPGAEARVTASSLRANLGSYRLRSGNFDAWAVETAFVWPDWASASGAGASLPVLTWLPGARGQAVLVWQGGSGAPPTRQPAGGHGVGVALGWDRPAYFVFSGQGFGHGVGMSQWGAREMAALGRSYTEILANFYSGVRMQSNYGR